MRNIEKLKWENSPVPTPNSGHGFIMCQWWAASLRAVILKLLHSVAAGHCGKFKSWFQVGVSVISPNGNPYPYLKSCLNVAIWLLDAKRDCKSRNIAIQSTPEIVFYFSTRNFWFMKYSSNNLMCNIEYWRLRHVSFPQKQLCKVGLFRLTVDGVRYFSLFNTIKHTMLFFFLVTVSKT